MGKTASKAGKESGGVAQISRESLPKLEGSEKQIKWAEDIRTAFVNSVNSLLNQATEGGKISPTYERILFLSNGKNEPRKYI